MRTVQELLETIKERDIELYPEGDQLRYRAPQGSLDDDLKQELIRHKPQLMEALKQPTVTYYQDSAEAWFKTADGRFWYLDRKTGERTELVAGNPAEDKPLPKEWFEAFGGMLGTIIKRSIQ